MYRSMLLRIFCIISIAVLFCCTSIPLLGQIKPAVPASESLGMGNGTDVLARVGEKIITVRDFRERSEFAVRPQSFKNKNIALNNLILEKILTRKRNRKQILQKILGCRTWWMVSKNNRCGNSFFMR